MCPMRVFLVLFSAMLACYLAWRNYAQIEKMSIFDIPEEQHQTASITTNIEESRSTQQICSKVSSGLWMLVDMASGRYLWKSMRSSAEELQATKTR